ncbi:type VI secretion system tip protein VgrG [Fulvivirga sp. 29W222]|uniref:Type VI secretion system tip protein VgrG n=1 Tax=Fulvivirga marina TaxID=2494733 RepID=A0A937FU27_9BACT|nr:type VI secretion system tip protein VgrG [Fulvivirga marina]MBL6445824.1 type VI secretion system tip protein VgrG [Fulvivirga marina]
MAQSLSKLTSGLVTYSVSIDGKEIKASYAVLSIQVFKGVNRISVAKLEILDGGTTSEDDFSVSNSKSFDPGKEIEIKAGYDSKEETLFKGIIIKHSLRVYKGKSSLQVECRDLAVSMTIGRKNAVFLDKKDSDIISEIIGNYKVGKKIEATKFQHVEVVQHYVTDWDFMLIRADINGLIVIPDDGTLNIQVPDLGGSPVVEVKYGSDMISFSGDIDARSQVSSINGVSWDMANQKVATSSSNSAKDVQQSNLKSSDLAKVIGLDKYTLQSAANIPLGVLDAWTAAKHLKSSLSKIKATVKFRGVATVKPGTIIEISGLSEQFNGKAFVGAVEHKIEDSDWITEVQLGLSSEWYAEETPNIEAPSAAGLFPPVKGLQTAIVKQIHEDKDGQYRVKVALPTLEKDNLTIWARLTNFYSTKDAGLFFYPEIEDEVIVGFLNEDPQSAIILGSVYSSQNKPVYTPEENNFIKGLVTKGQLKIEFDDENKIMTIITPAENKIVLDDKEEMITVMDKNSNKLEMSPDGITIDSPKDIVVKAGGNITMEAKSNIEMKATGDVKTEGMNVTSKGKTKFAAEGAMAEVKGSGQTVIKGGVVMIN